MVPRKLLRYDAGWAMPEALNNLVSALTGTGPALAFGEVQSVFAPENISAVIATSGSTNQPKDVALTSRALIESARLTNQFVGAKAGDKWSLLISPNHVAGVNVLVRSIELGTEPITTTELKADYSAIVLTQLYRALNGDEQLLNHLKNAKAVLVGGSAIPEDLLVKGRAAGINLITTYGMTETCGGCVYNGLPLPGVEIKINETIEIKSPTLASNYLNAEEKWANKIRNGYFVTDDQGELQDGKLVITGRIDDVIISGGKNISLSEIESHLNKEFPLLQSAAFGLADPEWGQSLNLALVGDFSENQIHNSLQNKYGIRPKRLLKVDQLPKSSLGKIDRSALIKMVN